MTNIEKAIAVLQKTNDGNDLAPGCMAVVQLAVNDKLSDLGQERFNAIYDSVSAGTYVAPWFHGIQHLLRHQGGQVTWKGIEVEHFTFSDIEREKQAAEHLAETCRMLESKGVPVNTRTAISRELFEGMPANSEWIPVMTTFYTAFANEGRCRYLVMNFSRNAAVAIEVVHGTPVMQYSVTDNELACYDLYHRLCGQGLKACPDRLSTYESFVAAMAEAGITPEIVSRVINAGLPQAAA